LPVEPRQVLDFEVRRNRFVLDVRKMLVDSQMVLGAPEAPRSLEDVAGIGRLLNEALQGLLRNASL